MNNSLFSDYTIYIYTFLNTDVLINSSLFACYNFEVITAIDLLLLLINVDKVFLHLSLVSLAADCCDGEM